MINVGCGTSDAILICHFCRLCSFAQSGALARSADAADLLRRAAGVGDGVQVTPTETNCWIIPPEKHQRVDAEVLQHATRPLDSFARESLFIPRMDGGGRHVVRPASHGQMLQP